MTNLGCNESFVNNASARIETLYLSSEPSILCAGFYETCISRLGFNTSPKLIRVSNFTIGLDEPDCQAWLLITHVFPGGPRKPRRRRHGVNDRYQVLKRQQTETLPGTNYNA